MKIWRLALTAVVLCGAISNAAAEDSKLYVFWDTVSPDGKYAMAWSTSGELDDLPRPDSAEENPVANYVIEVASHKIVVKLPESHYWHLYGGGQPNHFSLETAWSENSRTMLAIYDSRWSTDEVFLVDVSMPRAVSIATQLSAAFERTLKSIRRSQYTKYKDDLEIYFRSPWFVAPGRFYVLAGAFIPHHESPDFRYDLYFQIENGGTSAILAKAEAASDAESADRFLNRTYRTLHGLLSSDDQKLLVEEERAWLVRRDAIKSEQQKEAFINARSQELRTRVENVIAEKEKQ